jgi:hypothetical protein
MNRVVYASCLMAVGLLAAQPARAQVIRGTVLEAETNRPLRDVSISLLSADGRPMVRTVSDTTGAFWMRAARFGSFRISAELIGMTDVTTEPLEITEGATEIVLRMAETAVPLEPLTVEARGADAALGPLRGYYERMRWNQRAGIGRFITRDAIELRNPGNISDMLREMPRVTVSRARGTGPFVTVRGGGRGGECNPALFIDGTRINRRDRAYVDEYIRPADVEGVEVYVGLAQLPGAYHDENGCGVILVWTRRGTEGGTPMNWRRALVGAGILGLILLITNS